MASSSPSLTVPEPSTSQIWKSVSTHSLNPSDQAGPSNEEHGVDGLGGGDGGGDGGGGGGGDGGGVGGGVTGRGTVSVPVVGTVKNGFSVTVTPEVTAAL